MCLVLAAAGAAYLLLRHPAGEPPARRSEAVVPTARPATSAELPTALPVVIVPTPPRPSRRAAPPSAPSEPGAAAKAPAPRSEPVAAGAETPVSRPLPRLGPPRSYAGGVTLPGGDKIELGGIAWSETEPRALLNDRIVAVGGYVDGYSVSRIETDRVELVKDGVTIVLTVR